MNPKISSNTNSSLKTWIPGRNSADNIDPRFPERIRMWNRIGWLKIQCQSRRPGWAIPTHPIKIFSNFPKQAFRWHPQSYAVWGAYCRTCSNAAVCQTCCDHLNELHKKCPNCNQRRLCKAFHQTLYLCRCRRCRKNWAFQKIRTSKVGYFRKLARDQF